MLLGEKRTTEGKAFILAGGKKTKVEGTRSHHAGNREAQAAQE